MCDPVRQDRNPVAIPGAVPPGPHYACFDFRIASAIPLGELPRAAVDAREIVTILYGAVPAALAGAGEAVQGVSAAGGAVLLSVPAVARYLIRGRDEIVVEAAPGASERNVRLFLLGSALGILAYRRGLLPLHANAIVVDSAAHAFAGPSGAGKSTLAAVFADAGFDVLCDDVCALSFADDGRPLAWPGLPRVKLWSDAARTLGRDPATLERVVDGQDKYHVPIGGGVAHAVPLKRLYLLSRMTEGTSQDAAPGTVTRLAGSAAMAAVMENSYRPEYLAPLGLAAWHFQHAAALLAHVEVYAAGRAWGFDALAGEAARLAAHIRSA